MAYDFERPRDYIEITANKEGFAVKRFFADRLVDRYNTHDLLKLPKSNPSWARALVQGLNDYYRCAVCGWPLEQVQGGVGCRRGDCSMRPWPATFFDPMRMAEEYGHNPAYALGSMPEHIEDWQRCRGTL